ncbi:UNVERIFIED_CONTAM: YheC/D-like protein [Acetivibrio alkalicellulosi]
MTKRKVIKSKMEDIEVLLKYPIIKEHIPETLWYSSSNLKYMLTRYHTIYVKPDNGFQGNGIIKVRKLSTMRIGLFYENYSKCIHSADILSELKEIMDDRKYIIQQGIDLSTYNNCPFDARIVMQRPYYTWEITLLAGKVALNEDAVVTNVSKGAQDYPLNDILQRLDQKHNPMIILRELINLTNQLAIILGYKFDLRIIGFDMAVDKQGKIWFIEANTRPMCAQCKLVNDKISVQRYTKAKEIINRKYH